MKKISVYLLFILFFFISCKDDIKFREEVIKKHSNGKNRLIHRFKSVNGSGYKLVQKQHFNNGGFLTRLEDLELNRVKICDINSKGVCSEKKEFVNGLKDGMWIKWGAGGWVKSKTMYKAGKLHGKRRTFNNKGELTSFAIYENGKRIK